MITPQQLFDFALSLKTSQSNLNDEAAWRTATSRFYYSAFHLCDELVKRKRLTASNGTAHQRVIDALLHSKDRTLSKMGKQLQQCKLRRVLADYRLDAPFVMREVTQQCKACGDIIETATRELEAINKPKPQESA